MDAKRAVTIAGIIVGVLAISITALPFFFGSPGSENCLPPVPGSLFYLENHDTNNSHIVRVIIESPDNQTLAEESFVLMPMVTVHSQFQSTTKIQETFLITILVDGKNSSHETIISTTTCSTSFIIDPIQGCLSPPDIACRDFPCQKEM